MACSAAGAPRDRRRAPPRLSARRREGRRADRVRDASATRRTTRASSMFSSTKAFVGVARLEAARRTAASRSSSASPRSFRPSAPTARTRSPSSRCCTTRPGSRRPFLNPYDWDDVDKRNAAFASWPLEWEPGSRYAYHALSSSWVQAAHHRAVTGRDFREYLAHGDPRAARARTLRARRPDRGTGRRHRRGAVRRGGHRSRSSTLRGASRRSPRAGTRQRCCWR